MAQTFAVLSIIIAYLANRYPKGPVLLVSFAPFFIYCRWFTEGQPTHAPLVIIICATVGVLVGDQVYRRTYRITKEPPREE